jgi:hypothetical protein
MDWQHAVKRGSYVGRTYDPITAWLREFLESGYEATVALKQRLTLIVFRKQQSLNENGCPSE